MVNVPIVLLLMIFLSSPSYATPPRSLSKGASLSVEKPNNALVSANGVFTAGFRNVGDNAYCFAIWFTQSSNYTIVWMANRDQPVNGRGSVLSLLKDGNLVLRDIGRIDTWSTNTKSVSQVELTLLDTGNLVLRTSSSDNYTNTLWESFKFPTDTLLPDMLLTRHTKLVSSRSQSNYSSGMYSLYFDNDNVLRLLYDGPETSSLYWPDPALLFPFGRTKYNSSRIAFMNSAGYFMSSDAYTFLAGDFGEGPKRRLTIDFDGNLRIYSLEEKQWKWDVSWQAIPEPCKVHGICGANSLCVQQVHGKRCSCLPGFKEKHSSIDHDWSNGCEPKYNHSYQFGGSDFVELPKVDFYGFDLEAPQTMSVEDCKSRCLELKSCKAVMYQKVTGTCYVKSVLFNGIQTPNFAGTTYLRLPKENLKSYDDESARKGISMQMNCSMDISQTLEKDYPEDRENRFLVYLLWFVGGLGGVEMFCIIVGSCCLYRANGRTSLLVQQGQLFVLVGFRKFTYKELQQATSGFSNEVGKGGGGTVYKGVLPDRRVAAIKRLNDATHNEGEFLAEVSTIGKINHMNLIEMWGFCSERKHRLLVYEYMERGSLAENLSSNVLDWEQRFEIALGTAKGLAYLHEECLEWVLHCDVKPENILLDSNYKPKVADFGLSKLLKRGRLSNISSFSTMRGTRGYMAPEWVFNLPITSKVDVYSYGIVLLELITGQSPGTFNAVEIGGSAQTHKYHHLVTWVRDKMNASSTDDHDIASSIAEIMDSRVDYQYSMAKMEVLVRVALQCVHEEKDRRPTMSKVVEMLSHHDNTYKEFNEVEIET
ncbi:hypothetical protein Syun_002870 [Stephania yunnanensis]|uniref:Receptor-like serine/threonine-protein kinase n=1 Tax=Stephania yunnanensis TaxID=152371 RepID=A0AAP0L052_9MAGN